MYFSELFNFAFYRIDSPTVMCRQCSYQEIHEQKFYISNVESYEVLMILLKIHCQPLWRPVRSSFVL